MRLVLLLLVALAPGVARAQDSFSDRVDTYIASEMAREHVPGVHGGAWQGFRSAIVRFPDDQFTVIVLANLAESEPMRIAHRAAAVYDPDLETATEWWLRSGSSPNCE